MVWLSRIWQGWSRNQSVIPLPGLMYLSGELVPGANPDDLRLTSTKMLFFSSSDDGKCSRLAHNTIAHTTQSSCDQNKHSNGTK